MKKGKLELFKNGMIVKKNDYSNKNYYGVEGENWFIDLDINGVPQSELEYLYDYYCKNIDKSWEDYTFVDCCPNIDYINRYMEACRKANIGFTVLFCETQNQYPIWKKNDDIHFEERWKFIGYDYAYPDGSFYSCVYNDLVLRNIFEISTININENGLIETEEELVRFINLREKLKSVLPLYTLEEGNFIVYKLWMYV